MDVKKLFSGKAEDYTNGRPSYSEKLIEKLYKEFGFSPDCIIADIGSGTGKFAKQLLQKGSTVICVEPNEDMRQIAVKELASYTRVMFTSGDAENTKIPSETVNFVTAAQAFHWFDVDAFKKESRRILKTDGKAVLIWNFRDENNAVTKEYHSLFSKFCPNFSGFSCGIKRNDPKIIRFFNGEYTETEFDNPLAFDREKFICRSLSASYSIDECDPRFNEYIFELNALFDKYSKDGILTMPNKSFMYAGCV